MTTLGDIGAWASVVGVPLTLAGLFYAVRVSRQARTAAQAAEEGANLSRQEIQAALKGADLGRALVLIERLKAVHRRGDWGASVYFYEDLRSVLADVLHGLRPTSQVRQELEGHRIQLGVLERQVENRTAGRDDDKRLLDPFEVIIRIQDRLQELQSAARTPEHGLGKEPHP